MSAVFSGYEHIRSTFFSQGLFSVLNTDPELSQGRTMKKKKWKIWPNHGFKSPMEQSGIFFVSNNGKGVNPHISVSHYPHHFPIISDLIDVEELVDCKTVFLFRWRTGARVVKRLWKEWGDNENGEWKWGVSFLAWLAHDFEGKNDNNNNNNKTDCFAV